MVCLDSDIEGKPASNHLIILPNYFKVKKMVIIVVFYHCLNKSRTFIRKFRHCCHSNDGVSYTTTPGPDSHAAGPKAHKESGAPHPH